MDDIDVTSSMGRNLPCMLDVVEATTMLGFERNLALKRSPTAAAGPAGLSSGSALVRRPLSSVGTSRATSLRTRTAPDWWRTWRRRPFGVAALGLSIAPVRPASWPRLTRSRSSSRPERRVRVRRGFRPIWFLQTGARVGDRVSGLMLRVTTIHASSAAKTAAYYTQYLTAAPGEVPGVWCGRQAAGLGLSGTVEVEPLELLLSGRDPVSGTPLGRELVDRVTRDGRVVKAVSGFDATFSAPKSLSVWWGLTGDRRLLEAHDVAVNAVLEHLERFGSTTRIRRDGGRLHPDTGGLTMATFRQTTSRADDPQIHTHAVISAKVQTDDGRWWALDARYLKRHQRMLGGLYQSVLRSELTHRFGVEWGPIVNGQAEIAGMPKDLLAVFSKRAAAIDDAMAVKLDEFRHREGRDPSPKERAAMEREASADTRGRKSGLGVADLASRWQGEAADAGWTVERLVEQVERAAPTVPRRTR